MKSTAIILQKGKQRAGGNPSATISAIGMRTEAAHAKSNSVDYLVFLIPALEFVQLNVVGTLFGPELILMVVFAFLVFKGKVRISDTAGKIFVVLCSLWLVSQCATDIVRHSAFADYARGWSNIGMTLVNFFALYALLYGRPRRLIFYGWGLVVGSVVRYFVSPISFAEGEPWKFGFADPVTLSVILIASNKRCRGRIPIVLLIFVGILNLYEGTRTQGGCCLTSAFYLFVTQSMREREARGIRLKAGSIAFVAVSVILGLICIFFSYKYAASSGMLGEKARDKYETQSSGKWGVLLGGRTEMLGSIPAIIDSPILGHGSWAKDPTYLIAQRQALALMGYENAGYLVADDLEDGLIPSHSYFFGAWVNSGILGAAFFAWIFFLSSTALMRVYPSSIVLVPLLSYVVFSTFWNVLFSPYGAEVRIIFPYYVLIIMTCLGMVEKGRVNNKSVKLRRERSALYVGRSRTVRT